jgi:uncharacterized phage protein gp47/JayE
MPLNTTGFERPRLTEIKADYDARFTDALGPVNTSPDAVIGQIIGIFSAALDDAYETLQDNYDSMYPYSAEGTSLDGAVSFVGLERLGSTATTVTACVYGAESTLLPTGVMTRAGTVQYATTSDTVISRANALDVEIEVGTVVNSVAYQIIAGGVLAQYISDASATDIEIIAGLAAAFNPLNFTATATGSTLRLHSLDKVSDFPLTLDSNLTITKLGSPAVFTAIELGASVLPTEALIVIDSPILGWDSVSNLVAGTTGRDVESDADLRTRHSTSIRSTGAATVKAIRARLLSDIPEITAVQIYENRTIDVVDSMPSHSFETVVSGGATQDILDKLWELKPAGIETYGAISGQSIDDNGDAQTIKFSRPVTQYAWIRVSVDQLYSEEPLSATTSGAIKDAVLAYGATLGVGIDIIPQRFYGPIYGSTTGLGQITVEAAITALPGDTPSYSTNNISIGRVGIAEFVLDRVSVVGI